MPFTPPAAMETERFRAYGARHVDELSARFGIPQHIARSIKALAAVLPFRVNEYVLANLVDWHNIPDDPIFQMVFPQSGMLPAEDERRLADLVDDPAAKKYPTPLAFAEKVKCGVGRLRVDTAFDNGLSFWVSGDNLWKGAALNAVQNAELMCREGWLLRDRAVAA